MKLSITCCKANFSGGFMRLQFLAVCSLGLSGCATFQEQAAVNPLSIIEAKTEYCRSISNKNDSEQIRGIYESFCYGGNKASLLREQFSIPQPAKDGRGYLLNLMMVSDQICAKELRALSANQRTISASLSTAETALSAAATVVTGDLADNILSGLATTTGSTRGHINSEVFRGAQSEAITLLIQADREAIANRLVGPKAAKTSYTEHEANYFANEYHQACSLYNGLALLTEAAGDKAKTLIADPDNIGS